MAFSFTLKAIRVAQHLVNELYIKHPSHIKLNSIAGYIGVFPKETPLDGCDARLLIDNSNNTGVAIINSNIPEEGRKRFALAHELGHFILHKKHSLSWVCTEKNFLEWYHINGEEPEANSFAAELIMPKEIFTAACKGAIPDFQNISNLSKLFNTSLTSTAFRYVEIGNYPCAIIYSSNGKISWFKTSADFPYRIHRPNMEVNKYSCAGDYFINRNIPPDKAESVGTFCWFEDSRLDSSIKIFEQAIVMPRYNSVLSIIWEI